MTQSQGDVEHLRSLVEHARITSTISGRGRHRRGTNGTLLGVDERASSQSQSRGDLDCGTQQAGCSIRRL